VDVIQSLGLENMTVASPDVGGVKNARTFAKMLGDGVDLVVVDKRRPKHNQAEIMNIIGDVTDRNVIIIDDLIDTGSTFVKCADAMKQAGARSIVGFCTHPVFSGEAVKKIAETDALERLYVTDTIPLAETHEKIEVISVAPLFAEAIMRTHENQSISSLFEKIET
jgi:ribose-phosphate pyrophosphokinase